MRIGRNVNHPVCAQASRATGDPVAIFGLLLTIGFILMRRAVLSNFCKEDAGWAETREC